MSDGDEENICEKCGKQKEDAESCPDCASGPICDDCYAEHECSGQEPEPEEEDSAEEEPSEE